MSWLSKLKNGLQKTSSGIKDSISKIVTSQRIDPEMLEQLEDNLIAADLGPVLAAEIVGELSKLKAVGSEDVERTLENKLMEFLAPVEKSLEISGDTPHVIMVCGVNGNGKTTTVGKLASQYINRGYKVAIAACDTYRAASVEQLSVWCERAGAKLIYGEENADPASIAYRAYGIAGEENYDILLVDTAGRLHNYRNLMDELAKIKKVLSKQNDAVPHNTLLVIDATTGQNGIKQVEAFKQIIQIDGLVITKLDGTAKGGIVIAIARKFGIPIYAVGVGEHIDDLGKFNAKEFAQILSKL